MSLTVIWSPLSEEDVEEQLIYLENKWGSKSAITFLERIEESLSVVCKNLRTYLEIDQERHIHKFVLNKHITLYYQVAKESINLITFWNTRKDANFLKQILSKD